MWGTNLEMRSDINIQMGGSVRYRDLFVHGVFSGI
jgi:hypothetical protein